MPDTCLCRRLTHDESRELLRLRAEEGWGYGRLAKHFRISWSSARDWVQRSIDPADPGRLAVRLLHRAAVHARGGRRAEAVIAAEAALSALAEISSLPAGDNESPATHCDPGSSVLP